MQGDCFLRYIRILPQKKNMLNVKNWEAYYYLFAINIITGIKTKYKIKTKR